jgi:hypothetical protein
MQVNLIILKQIKLKLFRIKYLFQINKIDQDIKYTYIKH